MLEREDRSVVERLAGIILSFISRLEEGGRLQRIAARQLICAAASLAVENGIALADALPAAQAILSESTLVIAAPHLALPFEVMQSRIPGFPFELVS